MTYLSRHRPICAVLAEMKERTDDEGMLKLINEALDYAQRMSARLIEYKRKEECQNLDARIAEVQKQA